MVVLQQNRNSLEKPNYWYPENNYIFRVQALYLDTHMPRTIVIKELKWLKYE